MDYQDPGVARLLSFLKSHGKDECWEWANPLPGKTRPRLSFKGRSWIAARLFYTLWKGPIKEGLHILHTCDNAKCCNPAHLYEGTTQDNMNDACNRGAPTFKVPVEAVHAVRKGQYTQEEFTKKFDTHRMTYYNIKAFRSRKNV